MAPLSTAGWLQSLPDFQNVPAGQLQWFAGRTTRRRIAAGESLFKAGEAISFTCLLVSGRLNLVSPQGKITATLEAGDISGMLPYSRLKAATSSAVASVDTELILFPAQDLRELICDHYELTEALVHKMVSRARESTALQQQNEKMMALGKLSAGLAHELNNPAAALARDAQALQKHLSLLPESFKEVMNIRMTSEQVDAVNKVLFQSLEQERPVLSLRQRTDREDELADWLQSKGVSNGDELAEPFTDFGFGVADLEAFAQHVPQSSLKAVFKWISDNIITDKMVADMGEAARRIETLVGAVKSFTHMDRGSEPQYADIHTGIRSTLTLLGHKIRGGNVRVEEDYDPNLPPVKAIIGALNQVWTNLMDNALDAMEGRENSHLKIITRRDGDFVRVTVGDNGAGIPKEAQPRIFDPFFTTKEIGKGTGLGLDVVHRIVDQHRGAVTFSSSEKGTDFVVCFPING